MKKIVRPSPREEVEQDRNLRRARSDAESYRRKYREVVGQNDVLRDELDAALRLSEHVPQIIQIHAGKDKASEATAVALASDWHVEETVKAASVNGKNRYNLSIAKQRAMNFFERVVRMVRKEQQDVTIRNLILWLGGDFITSNIHAELPETCSLRPIDAMLYASELIESGIRHILAETDLDLLIPCSVGNHSRITHKLHVSSERGNSLEWMMYHNLAARFFGNSRVRFIIEDAYHTYVKVYGFTIRFHHGHAVRYQGGVGGLHIPLNKALAQWDKTKKADVDCYGHWHTYLPSRRYVGNGSLIGFNAFGVWIKAEYEPPIQAFFLIDRDRGPTVHIPILVD